MSFLTGWREGWKNAKTVDVLTAKYGQRCPALDDELKAAGITKEKWYGFIVGSDWKPTGLAYSLAGFTYYMTHGTVSNVGPIKE